MNWKKDYLLRMALILDIPQQNAWYEKYTKLFENILIDLGRNMNTVQIESHLIHINEKMDAFRAMSIVHTNVEKLKGTSSNGQVPYVVLFGPINPALFSQLVALTSQLEVPHIKFSPSSAIFKYIINLIIKRNDFFPQPIPYEKLNPIFVHMQENNRLPKWSTTTDITPSSSEISLSILQILKKLNWKNFIVLSDVRTGLSSTRLLFSKSTIVNTFSSMMSTENATNYLHEQILMNKEGGGSIDGEDEENDMGSDEEDNKKHSYTDDHFRTFLHLIDTRIDCTNKSQRSYRCNLNGNRGFYWPDDTSVHSQGLWRDAFNLCRSPLSSLKDFCNHFVIDTSTADSATAALRAALQLGMINDKNHFFLTNFDADTIDVNNFQHNNALIYALRLRSPMDGKNSELINKMETTDDIQNLEQKCKNYDECHKNISKKNIVPLPYEDESVWNLLLSDQQQKERIWKDSIKKKNIEIMKKENNIRTDNLLKNRFIIPLNLALMYDAVRYALIAFAETIGLTQITRRSISRNRYVRHQNCNESLIRFKRQNNQWPMQWGDTFLNQLHGMNLNGMTGVIRLQHLHRIDVSVTIIQVDIEKGYIPIGIWKKDRGVEWNSNYRPAGEHYKYPFQSLFVTVKEEAPYVLIKNQTSKGKKSKTFGISGRGLKPNQVFVGFCIDLMDELSKRCKFNYTLSKSNEKTFGKNSSGKWNGLIGEVLRAEADVALGGMTINYERAKVVDFTAPFMSVGIGMLFKRPKREKPGLFSFLSPLSNEVWAYIVIGWLGISIVVFIIARVSPYEWYEEEACGAPLDSPDNDLGSFNSLWFSFGALMQQGSEYIPRAISTRIIASFWWFFNLIMVSSYTANLAAFLTVERTVSPIEKVEDLIGQEAITYGTLAGGSTQAFFEDSKIPVYEKLWKGMSSAKMNVFTKSTEEGIKKVLEGNYAFFMESSVIEYHMNRDCNLTQIGNLLDAKGYGIALRKTLDPSYLEKMSTAILAMQEDGKLTEIYNKWWRVGGSGDSMCEEGGGESSTTDELGIENVGGIFVVLILGVCLSAVVVCIEFITNICSCSKQFKRLRNRMCFFSADTSSSISSSSERKHNNNLIDSDDIHLKHARENICQEFMRELKFAATCTGSSQKHTITSRE
ncbi:hypothetical protein SNEBB_010827 [Seison nebaliae]|nr:hypothetical protein SNEBB_010827 [Seison nebaliae]